MKTAEQIYGQLMEIAPEIAFSTSRELDHDEQWDGDGPDPREEGLDPYTIKVTAATVVDGKLIDRDAYLGSCWMLPDESIGDIGGYLPQLIDDVADDLFNALDLHDRRRNQLVLVRQFMRDEMRERYDEQRAKLA